VVCFFIMSEPLFSSSVVWYLFFAGAGSGTAFVVFLLDSFLRRFRPGLFVQYRLLFAPALVASIVLTVLGAVFLFFDLGRPERLLALITDPSLNALTVGAWSLLALVLLSGAQLLARLRLAAALPVWAHIILRWATAAAAVVVMLYTGLLLQSLSALHFLASPLLPVLFVLSSLSCGVALLLILGFLRQADGGDSRLFVRLTRAHLPLLGLEMIVLAGLLLLATFGTETAAASAQRLITGELAPAFWGGVVLLGLLLPLGLELPLRRCGSWNPMVIYALACIGGALALRFCLLAAAAHPNMGTGVPL
jgi:formate-dependent nitrite reductase membrane component NrfD